MFVLALRAGEQEADLVAVLEEENTERMRAGDPAELDFRLLRLSQAIRRVIICTPSAADAQKARELAEQGDLDGALRMLLRGWTFQPERGDSDAPYESIKVNSRPL